MVDDGRPLKWPLVFKGRLTSRKTAGLVPCGLASWTRHVCTSKSLLCRPLRQSRETIEVLRYVLWEAVSRKQEGW